MLFWLEFQPEAEEALAKLQQTDPKKHRKVLKTLGLMSTNLRHPGLKTHKLVSFSGIKGEEIFEAYVENNTPAAFRVIWYYGPSKSVITIVTVIAHL